MFVEQLTGKRYKVLELLGSGGMGAVYRAHDRLTGQDIALKHVLLTTNLRESDSPNHSGEELRVGLAREFQTLASLRHPHLINVLDYGFDAKRRPFFTMALVENARDIREVAGDCSMEARIELLIQMLQALAYVHRRGVVHRDLKPGHVLVDSQGQVKVLDFGLAVEAGEGKEAVGTLAYIAPEIIREQGASAASDLYAVGVMAYEMLTGEHPFNINEASHLISEIFNKQPDLTRLTDLSGDTLSANFAPIVGRLMAKQPEDRYQDAYQVIEEFCLAIRQPVPQESDAIRESFLQASAFVGREAEFSALSVSLDAAIKGNGSAWLVGGESGAGKSRLLAELRTRALIRGALVLQGQAVEGGGLPYQLWRDV